MLENVDWLPQLSRTLRVEDYFSHGNQLPLDESPPTWKAVSMLIPRSGSLGDGLNAFSVDCPLYASSILHLPECLLPVAQPSFWLLTWTQSLDKSWGGGGGFLTICFWRAHRGDRRGWGKECVQV